MRLKRKWPAICIWAVFTIFNIVMVASSSFFLGIFPSENIYTYCAVFTGLSILVMSLLTLVLGQFSSGIDLTGLLKKRVFKLLYWGLVLVALVLAVYYRVYTLSLLSTEVTGKLSLYENAMVGGTNITPDNNILSIAYSSILKVILLFTGNFISIPFYFQIACFIVFMICTFLTVKKLLGYLAAFVYLAYVAFMPVFTPVFSGTELSTDYLFMALFGLEMLLVATYLQRAYEGRFRYKFDVVFYIMVGAAIGFMAYLDAGTIIMILPFLCASLFLCGRSPKQEFVRLIFVAASAIICFAAVIIQEQGFMMEDVLLSNWATYYFHNLNTFSMFWTYTDYKIIYLVTLVAMSGIIVGFWRNRNTERISPWLLSTILIFSTVPFMGATRMNTQVFVTVYYAFILGCVASLIAMPASETGEYLEDTVPVENTDEKSGEEAEEKSIENKDEKSGEEAEEKPIENAVEITAVAEDNPVENVAGIAAEVPTEETVEEKVVEDAPAEETEPHKEAESPAEEMQEEKAESPSEETEPQQRFVPEGMVLPMDDEDADLTPRMKMPEFKGIIGADGLKEKLKIKSSAEVNKKPEPADDFDVEIKPGDDFDI